MHLGPGHPQRTTRAEGRETGQIGKRLLDVPRLRGVAVEREGAGRGLGPGAAADARPDRAPAVGHAEGDAGTGREGSGAGAPDRDAQSRRGGEDALTGAARGRDRERATADVRDAPATAG